MCILVLVLRLFRRDWKDGHENVCNGRKAIEEDALSEELYCPGNCVSPESQREKE